MLKDLHKRLRPMGILDILDETVELYKRNFVLLVGIAAFLYVPLFLFQASMQKPGLSGQKGMTMQETISFLVPFVLSMVLYVVASTVVTGALTFAISDRYLERATSIGACYKRVLRPRLFFSFVWANILAWLIAVAPIGPGVGLIAVGGFAAGMGGGTALVVFGSLLALAGLVMCVIIMFRVLLLAPAFFVETGTAWPAVKRSWQLMKGNAGKAFVVLLITSIAVSMLHGILTMPLQLSNLKDAFVSGGQPAPPSFLYTLVSTIVNTLLMPVNSIVVILLYYDVRIRKEGFDLELLARDLDERSKAFAAEGAAALPQEQTPPPPPQEPPPSAEGQA